jgi:H+/Cl- antiporter ClcA
MTILTEKTIYLTKDCFNSTILITIISIAACIGVIVGICCTRPDGYVKIGTFERVLVTFLITFFCSAFGLLVGLLVGQRVEKIAERTEYEIYLEDMAYNELAESPEYTIVSVEGKKIIIVDKEWRYYEGYEK